MKTTLLQHKFSEYNGIEVKELIMTKKIMQYPKFKNKGKLLK